MKILSVGAELFHEDGWTDGRKDRHDEANSRLLKLCERTQKAVRTTTNEYQ